MAQDIVAAACESCGLPSPTRTHNGHILCALCEDVYTVERGTIRYHLEAAIEHLQATGMLWARQARTTGFLVTEDVEELFSAVIERITVLMAHHHGQELF